MRRLLVRPDRATACAAGLIVCLVAAAGASGCASARARSQIATGVEGSLESYIGRVQAASRNAKPRPALGVQTVESWDRRLSSALLGLAMVPTAAQHRSVALEYRRLGILDMAHAHLRAAIRLDHHDAAAFDGLARIWRDWGFPHLGLKDANRAVQLAPTSATAANTLGTLLQAQGHLADAGRWYERALALEPDAAYALNNLCYASVMLRRESAVGTCQRAVAVAPQSKAARNNLALAFAASGNFERARIELERSGDAVAAEYNAGILYLADRQFGKAVEAFDAALLLNPHFERALARANQARAGAGIQD